MKLYKVVLETYVMAQTREEAEYYVEVDLLQDVTVTEVTKAFDVNVTQVMKKGELSLGWLGSLPWGDDDLELTCEEILDL